MRVYDVSYVAVFLRRSRAKGQDAQHRNCCPHTAAPLGQGGDSAHLLFLSPRNKDVPSGLRVLRRGFYAVAPSP